MLTRGRLLAAAGLFLAAATASRCTSAPPPPAAAQPDLSPAVSILELMTHIVDPIADNIFDAVGTDVTAKGTVETRPTTDEEWAKVMAGAVTLAEATNLLKIPRRAEPPGYVNQWTVGANAPELSGDQIDAHINADRAKWNSFADELRVIALEVADIVKARDADKLFDAGGRLDKACENCHLEYWYPGDRKAVLEDEAKRAVYEKKN